MLFTSAWRNKRDEKLVESMAAVNEFMTRTSMSSESYRSERFGGFMKNISGTLLALVFVFFSLISLISVNRSWDNSPSPLGDTPSRVSELGLRFAMQR